MKNFILILTILSCTTLPSCQNQESSAMDKAEKDTVQVAAPKVLTRSWPKDLPSNQQEITSVGIGNIILYDSLEAIKSIYPNVSETTINYNNSGWKASVVHLREKEWIRAEGYEAIGYITRIFTNSRDFTTKTGYKVGDSLEAVLQNERQLDSAWINKQFWIYLRNEGVYLKVDKSTEALLSKSKGQNLSKISPEGTIEEIAIICNDC